MGPPDRFPCQERLHEGPRQELAEDAEPSLEGPHGQGAGGRHQPLAGGEDFAGERFELSVCFGNGHLSQWKTGFS